MITEVEDEIIEYIRDTGLFEVVDSLPVVEDILTAIKKVPAAFVIYRGTEFKDFKDTAGTQAGDMSFWVIIFDQDLRGRRETQRGIYMLLDEVRDALRAKLINDFPIRIMTEGFIDRFKQFIGYGMIIQITQIWR